jgi:hypothetical protein
VWARALSTGGQELRDSVLAFVLEPYRATGVGAGVFTCATGEDGMRCWGSISDGLAGFWRSVTPAAFEGSASLRTIAAGHYHACALDVAGVASCLEAVTRFDSVGASPRVTLHARAVGGNARFVSLDAGYNVTCGVAQDASVRCWGDGRNGMLGDGTLSSSATPVRVDADVRFRSVHVGEYHVCAIDEAQQPWCWGRVPAPRSDSSASMPGDLLPRPTRVATDLRFRTLASGQSHTCGIDPEGRLWCWGLNTSGQLGIGRAGPGWLGPTLVALDGTRFVRVATRYGTTCGVDTEAQLWCWGENGFGQLATDDMRESAVPIRVALPSGTSEVTVGTTTVCARARDGMLWCWGDARANDLGGGGGNSSLGSPFDVVKCRYAEQPRLCRIRPAPVLWDRTGLPTF